MSKTKKTEERAMSKVISEAKVIVITRMEELPQACCDCQFFQWDGRIPKCTAGAVDGVDDYWAHRFPDCPLREVKHETWQFG